MIFLGDFAFPSEEIEYSGFPNSEVCCFNCEGYLSTNPERSQEGVFNCIDAITKLPFNQLIGVIANNHISDTPMGIKKSIGLAESTRIKLTGGGEDIKTASKPEIIQYLDSEVAIIAAGWRVIGCKPAGKTSEGVMPLNYKDIYAEIGRQKKLGRKVVLFLHWGYELEKYPQPSNRQFAHNCVDLGAGLIIGCHAHCIQGRESYNDSHIFYGLGNAVFQQGHYFGGRLTFPDYCSKGLCVSWDIKSNNALVADIALSNSKVSVTSFRTPETHGDLMNLSNFSGMSHQEYLAYFKKHRTKRKALPVFHEDQNTITFKLKEIYVMVRSAILGYAFQRKLINYDK